MTPAAPEEQLSPDAIDELSKDHLQADPPIEIPLSFADEDPASEATPLGKAVLDIALGFLNIPLREDAGVNNDKQGYIKSFFLEGLKWSEDTWDRWAQKFPQSGVAKPEWCAAFASFCTRKAYTSAGLTLPATLSASAGDLAKRVGAASRLLTREALFDADGSLRNEVTPPGPGDLVIWHAHVGILQDIFPSGAFTTIEGNTWRGKVRNDGVYLCNRSSLEKRADGTFKLIGFCRFASVDGQARAETPSVQQTTQQAQAAESAQPAEPAQAAEPVEPAEPAQAADPAAAPVQPVDPDFEPPPASCT